MRLVVFDLDGTLVDSRQDLADSTNDVLESYGAAPLPRDRVVMMVGEGARVLVARALEASGVMADLDEALGRFQASYGPRLLVTTRPYPGINEMLITVGAHATLAMLTNKPLVPSEQLVEAFGWSSHFLRVIGGDGPAPRKPDPTGLQELMELAGASAAETMLVGDSMVDVETARRAETAICVAKYGFGNARGDLALRGDEWIAETSHDVAGVIDAWIRRP
ncbi:MAG: HAD hydrolase-like protein [Acidobacteria bacterium]|nr:HAD hydrolase-like protein [Acidobacteriota bacterium]